MNVLNETEAALATRRRLLDAAGEVFAEKGFSSATVREICQKAQANIAAVNYHFGDKQKLYAAVFADLHCVAEASAAPPEPISGNPEERLRQFIRRFLKHHLDSGRPSWHGRLMAREMSEPTGTFESFVEDEVRPKVILLQSIVHDLVGPLPPRVVAQCVASVVGQMLHYHYARSVLKRIGPVFADLDCDLEDLTHHITRFSLGGIRAIVDQLQGSKP